MDTPERTGGSYIRDPKSGALRRRPAEAPAKPTAPPVEKPDAAPAPAPTEKKGK